MPRVSVIVPAYNAAKTILDTIQSLQQQTFTDFEVIVINDGSTDNTVELVKAVADPRVQVYSYENGGLPVARNRGISRATGEFLTFIDADDLWTPNKLESQLAALQQHPEAGVAYSWTAFIDENGQYLYAREPLYFEGNVYPQLLRQNFISNGSNILVRRKFIEAVGEFDPTLKSIEDWDYYLRLAAQCSFVVVPKYQILYRRTSQSMTAKVDVMEKYNLIVIERAFKVAPPELQHIKPQTLANTYRFLAQICIANDPDRAGAKKAGQKLFKAVQFYPKVLLQRKTLRLVLKVGLVGILPPQTATNFTKLLSKIFPDSANKNLPVVNPD